MDFKWAELGQIIQDWKCCGGEGFRKVCAHVHTNAGGNR